MKKNDVVKLNIADLTGGGDGVAHTPDGMVVFVPNTAVGDVAEVLIIKVKSNYAIGKLKRIITPAPDRIDNYCTAYLRCGGCVFRHISYDKECEIKYNQVKNSMQRIGKIDILPDDIIAGNRQNRYRNKAQYPVSKDANGKTVCGFYTGRSHRIAECDDCMLQPEIFNNIKSAFCSWADKFNITAYDEKTGKGILRHLYLRIAEATDQIMVCIIINGTKLPYSEELISDLLSVSDKIKSIQININRQNTNVIMGDICKTLWGDDYITDILCCVKVRLSAQSFYQVNREMAEKLYSVALEFAEPQGKTVLDLFCGAGTIGLSMAEKAKSIIGVEIVPEAVKDAEYNAQINAIDNARFICSDAATAAAQLNAEGECPDVVILDPPRKGCDAELIKTVAKDFRPERVVYVSCNDATLARDCLVFSELGYSVKKVVPVDLFPRTGHVETVVLMSRIK